MATRWSAGAVAVAAVLATAGCSSSKARVVPPVVPSTVHSVAVVAERDSLRFRVVQEVLPYAGGASTCENGKVVTPAASDVANVRVLLADRKQTSCYVLGPVLLTGHGITSARAEQNPTTGEWDINIHFGNDEFVTKVASKQIGNQVAIVLDHVVQAAPTINFGITGRDITISGAFDEAAARAIAAKLS